MGKNNKRHNRTKTRRVLAVLLSACMLSTTVVSNALAIELSDNVASTVRDGTAIDYNDVYEEDIIVNDSSDDENAIEDSIKEDSLTDEYFASKEYLGTWDKYSSKYFYNQLSAERKELWDRLDALCYSYLAGENVNKDFKTTSYSDSSGKHEAYVTDKVDSKRSDGSSIFTDTNDRIHFVFMFRASNPQYYFLNNSTIADSDNTYIYLGVYEGMAKASKRLAATEAVKAKLVLWSAEVGTPSSEADKLSKAKLAHDKVCDSVTYNNAAIGSDGSITHENDEKYYTQSIYSALILGTTVCAGYSEAYDALCNSIGIDSFSITSATHQWNEIRVNNSWYNVDLTWDDMGSGYEYFMLDDYTFADEDKQVNRIAHTYKEFWAPWKPACTQNIGSTKMAAGTTLPTPLGKVATPSITITQSGGSYSVKLDDDTSGAIIYYTTDGTEPSVGYTKSSKCNAGSTIRSTSNNIRAIAIKDKYLDSDICASQADDGIPMYRLYNPNSGEHFYTANAAEANHLDAIGWNYEGIAWYAPTSGDKVYRMYNGNAGDHHYTTNWGEAQSLVGVGWSYEGVAWYSGGNVRMLRAYNPNATVGTHHYTSNQAEFNNLISIGWKNEGYAWSALK